MFKKNELRLLWPFYMMALIASSFSVALSVWIIFFQHKFTFTQISFGLTFQAVAAILFEVPTGAIADIFGRKFSVVSGIMLQGLMWLALPFIDLPALLYLAFFLMGALRTLESGADKAWMIDWLKCNNEEKLVHDMFIKIQSLNSAGLVIGSLLTTLLLFLFEIKHLFFVQGCGYLFAGLLLFFFTKENIYKRNTTNKRVIYDTLHVSKEGINFLLKDKALLYLVLATSFAICSKDFGVVAWQPLLVDLSLPVKYLGIVFSGVSLIGIITPFLSKKILKKIGHEKNYLTITTIIEFIFLISLYFVDNTFFTYGIIVYISVMAVTDLQSPVGSLYFQSFIPSKIRATMGSVQSMIFAIFSSFSTIIGGYIMDNTGPKMALVCFSLFLIPAAFFYLRIKNKAHHLPIRIDFAGA